MIFVFVYFKVGPNLKYNVLNKTIIVYYRDNIACYIKYIYISTIDKIKLINFKAKVKLWEFNCIRLIYRILYIFKENNNVKRQIKKYIFF